MIARVSAALTGRSESISAQILRGASSTAVLKVVSTGLTLATAILLARFLGVEDYGIFAYAMSWVTLLGVFAGLGLRPVIAADVAVYHQDNDWARIRGIFRFAIAATVAASVICALVTAGIGWLMHRDDTPIFAALLLASLLLPLKGPLLPLGATQNGLRQVTNAQVPLLLVIPLSFLILLGGAFGFRLVEPSAGSAIALQLFAVTAGLASAVLLFRRGLTAANRPREFPDPKYESWDWIRRALPLMLMGSMFLVNSRADILMLGALAGAEAAGLYRAASRAAELVTFSLAAVSMPLGPAMARLYAAGNTRLLQKTVTRWARVAFVPAAVLVVLFVVWGSWFLGLFGPGFVTGEAYTALVILSVSQLICVVVGPVGLLLVMTKNERMGALGVSIAAALNIFLNALLIPPYGPQGAAYATAISTVTWNILLVSFVMKRLSVNPTIFQAKWKT